MPNIRQLLSLKETYYSLNESEVRMKDFLNKDLIENVAINKSFSFTHKLLNENFDSSSLSSPLIDYFESNPTEDIVLLFIDIGNFSKFTEYKSNRFITRYLDKFYRAVFPIIYHFDGQIEKLMGDGIVCVFGKPFIDVTWPEEFNKAELCAQEIIKTFKDTSMEVKVALHSGNIIYYKTPGLNYEEYTMIGKPITELFRLESVSRINALNFFVGSIYDAIRPTNKLGLSSIEASEIKLFSFPVDLQGVEYSKVRYIKFFTTMIEFINQLNLDIKNIFHYNIEAPNTRVVPTRHDPNLTFPIGADKKGKLLETCVLMIDIRNSTKISRMLRKDKVKLGKIYSAFIYAMTSIADEYGYVRNIIGDRVMVVFEPNDCFVNAINCAALMNSVATKILAKYVGIDDFKIGIGVDYGEMLVLKTGIRKKHEEQSEYKSLVWVGDAANRSSKLCDFANKQYSNSYFQITYEQVISERVLKEINENKDPFSFIFRLNSSPSEPKVEYVNTYKTIKSNATLESSEFAKNIVIEADGWKYNGCKIINLNVQTTSGTTAAILISEKVFTGFKNAQPNSKYLERFTLREYPQKPDTGNRIYGGYLLIPEILKFKI